MGDEITLDIGFDERLAARPRQRHHLRHILAQELAAAVDALAKTIPDRFDPPADAVACFE